MQKSYNLQPIRYGRGVYYTNVKDDTFKLYNYIPLKEVCFSPLETHDIVKVGIKLFRPYYYHIGGRYEMLFDTEHFNRLDVLTIKYIWYSITNGEYMVNFSKDSTKGSVRIIAPLRFLHNSMDKTLII